jgi:hypothetical protein
MANVSEKMGENDADVAVKDNGAVGIKRAKRWEEVTFQEGGNQSIERDYDKSDEIENITRELIRKLLWRRETRNGI